MSIGKRPEPGHVYGTCGQYCSKSTSYAVNNHRPKNPVMDVPIFTAILTFEKLVKGTKYTALVMHKDEEGCKTHEKMGFYDGWGAAFEQLLALTKTMKD